MTANWRLAGKKKALYSRAAIIRNIREYFIREGYLEVDTPLRIPAPAPEVHIDAVPSPPWFMHTSPEICMKRMLAAGFERIFQLCHCWRQDERGSLHLPEFTMLEWYRAGCCYEDFMDECEKLLCFVAEQHCGGSGLTYRGNRISLKHPWPRLAVREAFDLYGGISMERALAEDLFDEVMSLKIEPALGLQVPTFLVDYPADRAALARLKPGDRTVAERFELYIAGVEVANAFSELTDPVEQRRRFHGDRGERESKGKVVYPLPEPFLEELAALPPCAGIALGVDRLVMLLTDASSIDQIVAFTPEEL